MGLTTAKSSTKSSAESLQLKCRYVLEHNLYKDEMDDGCSLQKSNGDSEQPNLKHHESQSKR